MAAITDAPRDGLGGDADAVIRELYSDYAKALHGYVEQFCPDRTSADDIVQETFIRARPVAVPGQAAGEVGTNSGLQEILDRQLISDALQHLSPAHQSVLVETFYRGETAPGAGTQIVRHLIVVMLLAAAALDLTRCGQVMAAARHPASAAGLVTAGLAATALTARTARGCQAGQRWAAWAALLIGVASAPQAAASGFRSPYMIPDSASAALGILLAVTILATAGPMDRRDTDRESSCHGPGSHAVPGDAAGSSAAAPKSSRKP